MLDKIFCLKNSKTSVNSRIGNGIPECGSWSMFCKVCVLLGWVKLQAAPTVPRWSNDKRLCRFLLVALQGSRATGFGYFLGEWHMVLRSPRRIQENSENSTLGAAKTCLMWSWSKFGHLSGLLFSSTPWSKIKICCNPNSYVSIAMNQHAWAMNMGHPWVPGFRNSIWWPWNMWVPSGKLT